MDLPQLRIAIVDRQRVFLDALCYRLSGEPDLEVVSSGDDVDNAQAAIEAAHPDVLILDGDIPLGKAFDLIVDVRRRLPSTKYLLLTSILPDSVLDQALRLRVEGILSRFESLTRLVEAIRKVAAGERPLSAAAASRLEFDATCGEYQLRARTNGNAGGLTDRQIEILRHLARGESVKAVARKLFLSPKSVDNQKFRIMSKLGVRDKVSLALYAVREGLIQP